MPPGFHGPGILLEEHFLELVSGPLVGLNGEVGQGVPLLQELKVVFFNHVVPVQVQAVKQLVGQLRALELQPPQRRAELRPPDLPRPVHVQRREGRGDPGKVVLVQGLLEVGERLGAPWVQLVDGGEAAAVPVQHLPEILGLLGVAQLYTRLEEASLGQDHGVGQCGAPGADQVSAAVPSPKVFLELEKLLLQPLVRNAGRRLLLVGTLFGGTLLV
mmetsp:Transcript_129994/g.308416  ORF Transcript_129994/g.308416 Transcript_129994/m.308416 type:complete len:216 (+) Transcript_129994:1217-1864(+)